MIEGGEEDEMNNVDEAFQNTPEMKQLKQRQRKKPALDFMKTAEQLHFKYAQAQLQQAIKLQACLANRKFCEQETQSLIKIQIYKYK